MEPLELSRRRLAAPCGVVCSDCPPCDSDSTPGCGYHRAGTAPGECAVFVCCVLERGLEHCGQCLDFPCRLFLSLAGSFTVAHRYRALTRRAEIGTEAWLAEQQETSPTEENGS